jgi:hypothetical protein
MYKKLIILSIFVVSSLQIAAQKERKVSFVGSARSIINSNSIAVIDSMPDSTTAKNNTGGYALIDMGVNIKPNKNTEILGMFRIRNGYGGFWGSQVTFDVRQLWVKGVVANAVRYQIGDLNLKQTPFTLYNHHADQIDSLPSIFRLQNDIIQYERFYLNNNSWRMQGANVDFGFTFSKYLKEINIEGFITRLNATNFANVNERLMSGANLEFVLNDNFQFGLNHNSVFDVKGTVPGDNIFSSSVNTLDFKINKNINENTLTVKGEIGKSNYSYAKDTLSPNLSDHFIHALGEYDVNNWGLKASVGYLNVGPDFRSIGAQSKDVNYNASPLLFNRYTNVQNIRPIGLFDVIGNENIYNRTISSNLAAENPLFNTIMPYGLATFNRQGMYGKIQYKAKNGIVIQSEYFNLSEIRGQGSKSLKQFSSLKLNATLPIHQLLNMKKTIHLQAGMNMQNAKRNSTESVENVDFKSLQWNAGLNVELFKDFELIAGIITQNNDGIDFSVDRNAYGIITYFNQKKYNIQQSMKAIGFKYNFSTKTYLSAVYTQSIYNDLQKNNASFDINQYGIIYNITL